MTSQYNQLLTPKRQSHWVTTDIIIIAWQCGPVLVSVLQKSNFPLNFRFDYFFLNVLKWQILFGNFRDEYDKIILSPMTQLMKIKIQFKKNWHKICTYTEFCFVLKTSKVLKQYYFYATKPSYSVISYKAIQPVQAILLKSQGKSNSIGMAIIN